MTRLFAYAALVLSLISCNFVTVSPKSVLAAEPASDETMTKSFNVGDFTSLGVKVACTLEYEMSDTPQIKADGPKNVVEALTVEQDDSGKVTVSLGRRFSLGRKKLVLYVNSSTLEALSVSGACDFICREGLVNGGFEVNAAGASDIMIEKLETGDALIKVDGAGDIKLGSVEADRLEVRINGAGDLRLAELDSDDLIVKINGAGDAVVAGETGKADLVVNGAGSIDCRGLKAVSLSAETNGVGRIKR